MDATSTGGLCAPELHSLMEQGTPTKPFLGNGKVCHAFDRVLEIERSKLDGRENDAEKDGPDQMQGKASVLALIQDIIKDGPAKAFSFLQHTRTSRRPVICRRPF
jgi:hypothetical protein